MRLALTLSYSGAQMSLDADKVLEAERLGFDSVWTAESYGSDAVTPAAWIATRERAEQRARAGRRRPPLRAESAASACYPSERGR